MKDTHRHTHVQSGWKLYEEEDSTWVDSKQHSMCVCECVRCVSIAVLTLEIGKP